MIYCHRPAPHDSSKVELAPHIPMVASGQTDGYGLSTWGAFYQPPTSTPPMLLNNLLQCIWEVAQSWPRSATLGSKSAASVCNAKVARSQPPSASLSYMISASKCVNKLIQSRPPSTALMKLALSLQVPLLTRSITASKCISKFTRSRPPSASPNSLNHGLGVHPSVTGSWPPNASPNSLKHSLQVHL
jgi:hypothetical protein